MANILYYPQMSMYDKETKQFLPQADGNINMMRNTINEWKKHRPEDKFYVLIPQGVFLPHHTDLNIDCQYLLYKNYVISARVNRYNFPMKEFSSILSHYKFDLLISDVIELTPNFKQMFKIEFGYTPKIISNIRHVDEGKTSDYILSVVDGMVKSDLVTILSKSMIPKLKLQMSLGNIEWRFAERELKKLVIFEPSISEDEIIKYRRNYVYSNSEKVIITFPGRLSRGEENRTNWSKFIVAIHSLRKQRQDYEVYFTDPNNSMSLTHEVDWIHTIEKDREEYFNLLHKTDVIVSLMDVEGFGGISIREALLMGCRPLIPDKDEYKNMSYNLYNGFTHSPVTVADLEYRLDWIINRSKCFGKEREFWSKYGKQFTVEEQFKNLLPKIEEIL